jgi:hypothetical protein
MFTKVSVKSSNNSLDGSPVRRHNGITVNEPEIEMQTSQAMRKIEFQLCHTKAELRALTREAYYSKTPEGGCMVRLIASIEGEYKPAYPYDRPNK